MADKLNPMSDNAADRSISEAICIDTARVYDSCADKDCLADLRVYSRLQKHRMHPPD